MHIAPPRRPAAAIQAALATIRAEVEARAADPKNENCGFILDDLGVLGQTQVVVGRQVHLAGHRTARS